MALGKKTLYVMLPVNLLLWTYIFYAVYQYMQEPELDLPGENSITQLKLEDDTTMHSLNLNYPDPFLKDESLKKSAHQTSNELKKPSAPKSIITHTAPIAPPKEIKYLGLILNKTSGLTTALVSINGRSYIIKKGEIIDGVNFESISDQIIVAKIGKEKLTINKF